MCRTFSFSLSAEDKQGMYKQLNKHTLFLNELTHCSINAAILAPTNVTLEHKSSFKLLGYICSNSQKYIVLIFD